MAAWKEMDSAPKDGTPILVFCRTQWCAKNEYHVVTYDPTAGGSWKVTSDDSPNMGISFPVRATLWKHIDESETDNA